MSKCPYHSGELIRLTWDLFVCIPSSYYVPHIHEIKFGDLEYYNLPDNREQTVKLATEDTTGR